MTDRVETRSQERGAPLKKPGAYNTDAYYQAKDEGYGDLGVNQEPDAGAKDTPGDPEYKATAQELQEADRARAAEDQAAMTAEEEKTAKEESRDLPDRKPDTAAVDQQGEPVPVNNVDPDAQEEAEVPL